MPIISQSELKTVRNSYEQLKLGSIVQLRQSFKQRNAVYGEVTIFLSHKHSDGVILESIIILLKEIGVNVYIDWLDETMPAVTSGVTATKLKEKMRECHKFILLATEDAIASKWCNWELGYSDAWKLSSDNLAILPIKNDNTTFSGNEYLQIYPYIQEISLYGPKYGLEVVFPQTNKKIDLKTWLNPIH